VVVAALGRGTVGGAALGRGGELVFFIGKTGLKR
jgi:hypothetical protein